MKAVLVLGAAVLLLALVGFSILAIVSIVWFLVAIVAAFAHS